MFFFSFLSLPGSFLRCGEFFRRFSFFSGCVDSSGVFFSSSKAWENMFDVDESGDVFFFSFLGRK